VLKSSNKSSSLIRVLFLLLWFVGCDCQLWIVNEKLPLRERLKTCIFTDLCWFTADQSNRVWSTWKRSIDRASERCTAQCFAYPDCFCIHLSFAVIVLLHNCLLFSRVLACIQLDVNSQGHHTKTNSLKNFKSSSSCRQGKWLASQLT
jgi:hypothetical protein